MYSACASSTTENSGAACSGSATVGQGVLGRRAHLPARGSSHHTGRAARQRTAARLRKGTEGGSSALLAQASWRTQRVRSARVAAFAGLATGSEQQICSVQAPMVGRPNSTDFSLSNDTAITTRSQRQECTPTRSGLLRPCGGKVDNHVTCRAGCEAGRGGEGAALLGPAGGWQGGPCAMHCT